MSDGLLLALMVLGAYRLYQLLGRDTLPGLKDTRERLRDWIASKGSGTGWRDGTNWAKGIDCPWCMGSWCAIGVTSVVWSIRSLPLPGLWYLGVATGVGVLGWFTGVLEDLFELLKTLLGKDDEEEG